MAIEMDNSFTVPVPPEHAWDVLLDVERIAPCMPGASVTSVAGDEVDGQVKVKLGPLALAYKGTAKFTDKNQANRTISLDAAGKETKGAGTASATVQAVLTPGDAAGSTLVSIHTSLNVTGKPAQFGRSLLPEVSGKLIAQFAANLETLIATDAEVLTTAAEPAAGESTLADTPGAGTAVTGSAEAGPATATGSAVTNAPAAPEESLDAFRYIVIPVLKRVLPVAAGGAVLFAVARRLIARRRA